MLADIKHPNYHTIITMKFSTAVILAFSFFIYLGMSSVAQASGNYHVEVIVVDNANSGPLSNAYSDNNVTPLPSKGKTWHASTAYLNNYASKLRNSSSYNILQHTAWGQKSAGYSRSAAKKISGNGMNGWVKVYATSLLFVQLDINFRGHKIKERRRLKLNEVHYFDNAGFGVLLRVSRS